MASKLQSLWTSMPQGDPFILGSWQNGNIGLPSMAVPASGLGSLWQYMCNELPEWEVELILTVFVQLIGFWLPATIYQLIDLLFPAFSMAHKIQPDPRRQPKHNEIVYCVLYASMVTLCDISIQFILGYLMDFKPLFQVTAALPSFWELTRHFIIGNLAREVLAYYVHRVLHHPFFYTRFHKLHHNFTAPIAFTGLYTTPVEHIFADVIPILAPLALISRYYEPVHILSFNTLLISVLLVGTAEHSGYDFAQPPVSKVHDLHHEKFNVNYGSLHFMDWLHGTNKLPSERGQFDKKTN